MSKSDDLSIKYLKVCFIVYICILIFSVVWGLVLYFGIHDGYPFIMVLPFVFGLYGSISYYNMIKRQKILNSIDKNLDSINGSLSKINKSLDSRQKGKGK